MGDAPADDSVVAWSLVNRVRTGMPPIFLLHAGDDKVVPTENVLLLQAALRANGCAVALHLFEAGSHGFGLRGISDTALESWPDLLSAWGRAKGIFALGTARRQSPVVPPRRAAIDQFVPQRLTR